MNSVTEKILNGASLSTVMVPDPAFPSNYPAHDETYKMKFIYLDGDRFWAQTSPTHRSLRTGESFVINNVFNYSVGYKRQMAINSPDQVGSIWADISGRYAKFEWKIREDFETVWEASYSKNVELLKQAILDGRDMKLAIKDEDGYWSVLPVDLANLEQESGDFIIRTEIGYTPAIIPDKPTLIQNLDFIISARNDVGQFKHINVDTIAMYYCCYSNGTYYNFFDEPRDIFRNYEDLRVFARKESYDSGFETITIDEMHQPFDQ